MGWTGRISGTLARLKRQKSKKAERSYTGGVRALCKESVKTWHGQNRENPVNRLAKCARFFEAVTWERNNRVMTFNAAREWQFSSEQGKANYEAAQKQYPAQAIVDMAALRNNMRHLVSVVGGPNSGTRDGCGQGRRVRAWSYSGRARGTWREVRPAGHGAIT